MDLKEAKARVGDIKKGKDDDELAHGLEDKLYADFVRYIANGGKKDLRKIANELLKTEDIDFARWCA